MRKLRLATVALVASMIVGSAAAQDPIQFNAERGGGWVNNTLPIPISVLVTTRTSSGETVGYSVQIVQARSRERISVSSVGTPTLARIEPIHAAVPANSLLAACQGDRSLARMNSEIDALRLNVENFRPSDAPEALAYLTAQAQISQLRHQQRLDEIETEYDKASWNNLLHATNGTRDPTTANADTDRLLNTIASIAMRTSDALEAKTSLLWDEAEAVSELIKETEAAQAVLRSAIRSAATDALGMMEFSRRTATAMEKELHGTAAFSGNMPIRRACSTPAGTTDWVETSGVAAQDVTVALGTARYDRGGSAPVVFRRVGESTRWVGLISWPAGAKSARVTLGSSSGTVQPGRPSFDEVLARSEGSLKNLKKRAANTRFRRDGGDIVKTIPVP
jgi:hypothetical protein